MHLPASFPRRLTGAAAIACAAALVPAAALAATSSPAAQNATASANCATSGLVVWLNVPPGNNHAGGASYYLEFTNLSGHACTLRGSPRGLGGQPQRPPAGQPGGLGQPQGNHGQARQRPHRDRRTADRGYGQLQSVLPAASAGAGNGRAFAHSGRAARLPTEPDRLHGDPLPAARMRAHRTGLDPRWPGNAWRSSSRYLNSRRDSSLACLPRPGAHRGCPTCQMAVYP